MGELVGLVSAASWSLEDRTLSKDLMPHTGSKIYPDLATFRHLDISPDPWDQRGIVPSFLLPAQGVSPHFLCSCCSWSLHGPFQGTIHPTQHQGLPRDRGERSWVPGQGYLSVGKGQSLGQLAFPGSAVQNHCIWLKLRMGIAVPPCQANFHMYPTYLSSHESRPHTSDLQKGPSFKLELWTTTSQSP